MITAAAHHVTPVTHAVGWALLVAIILAAILTVSKLLGRL